MMRIIAATPDAASASFGTIAAFALLLPMEAGVPIPIPADLVMVANGQRAAAGDVPLWVALVVVEGFTIWGTVGLFLALRGPAKGILAGVGPRVGLTPERLARA